MSVVESTLSLVQENLAERQPHGVYAKAVFSEVLPHGKTCQSTYGNFAAGFSLIRIFSYRFPCEARFTRTGLRVKSERTEYMWRGVRACFEHATYSRTGATYEKSVSNFTAVDTEFGT